MRAAALLVVALAGCSAWKPKPAPPRLAPAPAARPLSDDQRKVVERRFYEAVDAYLNDDYDGALGLVKEILELDPSNRPALALRKKSLEARKLAPARP